MVTIGPFSSSLYGMRCVLRIRDRRLWSALVSINPRVSGVIPCDLFLENIGLLGYGTDIPEGYPMFPGDRPQASKRNAPGSKLGYSCAAFYIVEFFTRAGLLSRW